MFFAALYDVFLNLLILFHNRYLILMNGFCGLVNQQMVFRLISSRDYCQRSSPLWTLGMPQTGFETALKLISGLVDWSCAVVITTKPQWLETSNSKSISLCYVTASFSKNISTPRSASTKWQTKILSITTQVIQD